MKTNPVSPELLRRLLDEHAAALALYASQWTELAEDCVQEAFVELVRQPTLPDNPPAWLFRVVRNRAISAARASGRRRRHETLAGSLAPRWVDSTSRPPVDADELAAGLDALDEGLREVVIARVWGGLSFEQIGVVVGVTTSTAHRRYEAALKALRQRWEEPCVAKTPPTTNPRFPTT